MVRFPGRDHPRAVLAVVSPFPTGFRRVHLVRPVAFACRRGIPRWLGRARAAVMAAIDGAATLAQLAAVAELAHRGQGIRRR